MLESINSPADIKALSIPQLTQLANEIRARLIRVTSKTGGHLAPNLGAVEITLAMHYVFDSPKDQFVWDVGHQAYVHKLLTGRNDRFDTLRTLDGLSGFPKRGESHYDTFGTGHASTSISAAVGFAIARDQRKQRHEVLAVIGDGALTGGMAYEALNHAGDLGLNMKIVLNDNEMSIDRNVGALSEHLTRLRTDPNYNRAKEDMGHMLNRIPSVGPFMADVADRMKDSVKYLLVSNTMFEQLGIKYYGPINGHDIEALIHMFENSKNINKPVLMHVVTQKGRGYVHAEARPDKFHGCGAFDIKTGTATASKKSPTYTDVFAETLIDLAHKDARILGITAAMGSGTGIATFGASYPERVIDVGIAEEHAVTMAAALALSGEKPVVALYSTFLQRGFDQVMHDCALQQAPVVFAVDRGGLVGEDGPTHHGVFDLGYLRMIPGMTVMAPKDERELQDMLYSALQYDGPVAVRYPRGAGPGAALTQGSYRFIEKGNAEVLSEEGPILCLAIGAMVAPMMSAAPVLAEAGLATTVVNARFAAPLDRATLLPLLEQCQAVVTLEENVLAGGFGAAVLELMADAGIQKPTLRIGVPDQFVEQGAVARLHERLQLDATGIVAQIQTWHGEQHHG